MGGLILQICVKVVGLSALWRAIYQCRIPACQTYLCWKYTEIPKGGNTQVNRLPIRYGCMASVLYNTCLSECDTTLLRYIQQCLHHWRVDFIRWHCNWTISKFNFHRGYLNFYWYYSVYYQFTKMITTPGLKDIMLYIEKQGLQHFMS